MAYRTRKCASRRRKASRHKTYRRGRRGGNTTNKVGGGWYSRQIGPG